MSWTLSDKLLPAASREEQLAAVVAALALRLSLAGGVAGADYAVQQVRQHGLPDSMIPASVLRTAANSN